MPCVFSLFVQVQVSKIPDAAKNFAATFLKKKEKLGEIEKTERTREKWGKMDEIGRKWAEGIRGQWEKY